MPCTHALPSDGAHTLPCLATERPASTVHALASLSQDVLESKAYKKELEESFGQEALDKLHKALEDGHVTLKAAEQRRYWGLYTQRVNNRMKAEIDALLRAIITRGARASSTGPHQPPLSTRPALSVTTRRCALTIRIAPA
jgi:hypothetical protein